MPKTLWRCVVAVGLLATQAASAAEIACVLDGKRQGWIYECRTGVSGCNLRALAASDRRLKPENFVAMSTYEQFRVYLGGKRSIDFQYPATSDKNTIPTMSLIGGLVIDGRRVLTEKLPKTYLGSSIQIAGYDPSLVAALRGGKMLQTTLTSPDNELLITMNYPLDGFAQAMDEAQAALAAAESKLKAGDTCKKEAVNPFGFF